MIDYRLSLGHNIGVDGRVTDADLQRYLHDTVSPLFPGFAVTEGLGYWKGQPERSTFIDIITEDSPETRANVDAIAREYDRQFHQDAVLVTRTPIDAEFVTDKG